MMRGWANLSAMAAAAFARQAPRAFMWAVVACAAGIVLYFSWRTLPLPGTGAIIALPGLILFFIARRWNMSADVRMIGAALFAVGLGHTAAELRTARVATALLIRQLPATEVRGRIASAELRPTSGRVVLEKVSIIGMPAYLTPTRVQITLSAKSGLPHVGDYIAVRAVLRPPGRPVIPDGFQYRRFLYFGEVGAVGYGLGAWRRLDSPHADTAWDAFLARVEGTRRAIADHIETALPDRDVATVAAALIMGEQSAIPEDLQEAYRKSGLAHLLSISGVHMSILAAVVFFLMRRGLTLIPVLALRFDTKKAAAVVALSVTTAYVLISGLSVPAVRSYLMIAVVLVAVLLDRTAISLRTVAWAALVLMLIYPDAVIGASFQMSFMAVLALVAIAEHLNLQAKWRSPEGEFLFFRAVAVVFAGILVTDLVAGGATAIFAIYHFNRFPTYSMATNFLAAPLATLWIMPWALVATLLMPLGLDHLPLTLMGYGVNAANHIVRTVAAWPGAQIHVPPMDVFSLTAAAFGLIFLCLWRGRVRWFGLAFIAGALIQPWVTPPPDVIVDEDAHVVAVSAGDGGLMLRPGRGDRFVREVWLDRFGASAAAWPTGGAQIDGLRCDAGGCILQRNAQRLLIAFHDTALAEDCAFVDAAVSLTAASFLCDGQAMADRPHLRRYGAVALWLTPEGIRRRFVAEAEGERPWSPSVTRWRRRETQTANAPAVNTGAGDPPDDPAP
jgi:competence protein ComEC